MSHEFLTFISFNIWRLKCKSIRFSHLELESGVTWDFGSQVVFPNILKAVIKLAVIWLILKCYYVVDLILDSVWITLVIYCKFCAFRIIGPELWPEGSYVCPSVLLSGSFLVISSLVFPETQHGVRGLCVVVHDSRIFLKKDLCPKKGEVGQK